MSGTPAREGSLLAGLRIIAEFNAATQRLRADLGVSAAELPLIEAGLLALAAGEPAPGYLRPPEESRAGRARCC
jgi:hypothetical protein